MGQYGVIYIINNKMRDGDDLFKVGRTYGLYRRLDDLNKETSNIGQFEQVAIFPVSDMAEAEAHCHRALKQFRVQNNKEIFKCKQNEIIRIVQNVVSNYKPENGAPEYCQQNETLESKPDEFQENHERGKAKSEGFF